MLELERRIPVNPPKVNKKINPLTQSKGTDVVIFLEP